MPFIKGVSNKGEKHPMYGKHHSEETRKKISNSVREYAKNPNFSSPVKRPEVRAKISKANKGKKRSAEIIKQMSETTKKLWEKGIYDEERNKKISLANKGRKCLETTKEKLSLIHKGRKYSEKSIQNMRIAAKKRKEEGGYEVSLETRGKISNKMKGRKLSEEHIKKIVDNRAKTMKDRGYWFDEETKKRLSLNHIGKKQTEETKKKISDNAKINPNFGMKGKHHSPENIKVISERSINNWKNLEYRNKVLNALHTEEARKKISISMKKVFENQEYKNKVISILQGEASRKKALESLFKRPTSFEQKISDLCFKFNLPFVYKGNGGFLINFKNPDFVNEKDKIVIEVFYSWFKIRDYDSIDNYKEFCRKKYEPAGWKVIFLDENDVLADNWEEKCLNKINEVLIENEKII